VAKLRATDVANLAEREAAEAAIVAADKLARDAKAAADAPVGVRSVVGGKRSGLIVTRRAVSFTDRRAALQWCMVHRADELTEALLEIVRRHKGGDVPGVDYVTEEKAR
jgi:hypothetical protein